ncbi:hypothetical protein [Pseudenhygromyxa sp. WMMC2535]|uniref:hypothetical protein n=1 Tax=Pseudenhygromyxa sp. WMMC2535 TaxID=2712867 RepID=UPI001C3D01E9|nr:hypothetical protein [Pseudenhygromyxa sp. WMMC2535]
MSGSKPDTQGHLDGESVAGVDLLFQVEKELGRLRSFGFQFLLEAENLLRAPTLVRVPGERGDDEFDQVVEVGHRPDERGRWPASTGAPSTRSCAPP